jgi:hypothetical protein
MPEAPASRVDKFVWNWSNTLRILTFCLAAAGAATSFATWMGHAVFSVYDLNRGFSDIGTKVDAIIARNEKTDQENATYREYTDRRFNWLDNRLTVVEVRTSTQVPQPQTPTPSNRYEQPARRR